MVELSADHQFAAGKRITGTDPGFHLATSPTTDPILHLYRYLSTYPGSRVAGRVAHLGPVPINRGGPAKIRWAGGQTRAAQLRGNTAQRPVSLLLPDDNHTALHNHCHCHWPCSLLELLLYLLHASLSPPAATTHPNTEASSDTNSAHEPPNPRPHPCWPSSIVRAPPSFVVAGPRYHLDTAATAVASGPWPRKLITALSTAGGET